MFALPGATADSMDGCEEAIGGFARQDAGGLGQSSPTTLRETVALAAHEEFTNSTSGVSSVVFSTRGAWYGVCMLCE